MTTYRCAMHYPDGYAADRSRRWPLIIVLHGSGERHMPMFVLKRHRFFRRMGALTSRTYPSIVAMPHCPPREYWDAGRLSALLDRLLHGERADPHRVYLTGFSMGGYGTWRTAAAYPERFAAIAPICGGGNPQSAPRLATMPIWAFHGVKDEVVPVLETRRMVDAIIAAGGSPHVTFYPEGPHNVWDEAYGTPDLYAWFLQHTRP